MDDPPQPAPDPQPPIHNGVVVVPEPESEEEERCTKKPKLDEPNPNLDGGAGGELKRIAEIVLVLSTMAAMRAGRKPTGVEVDLMREARTKLAHLCQGIAPKDIVASEAIGAVIEDLGFNAKFKDQRLGFRTPKMSIAERYSHAKWKMEEAKKFSAPSTTYASQPLQTSIGGTVDNRVPTHTVRMIASDKSSHAAIPSTGTVMSIPPQVSVGSSAALQYQSTSNEVRPPVVPGVISSTHLGRNPSSVALPKVEHSQFKVGGGSNGPPYVLQVQANSSANQPLVNAPTWSMQAQSSSMARSTSENKVPTLNSAKVEVAADVTISRAGPQITTDQSFRPFTTQTVPVNLSIMHQPLQGMNRVQAPVIPSHADIAKIVQKVLLPKLPDHPTWTPPSRDYMNKGLTCQICEVTVNEVDTVLLCDACEKGFHLKCLPPSVLRGIHNRVDWYCMKCLGLSGGKPLPPKYGRVMRSSNTPPKLPSNTDTIQPSSEKEAGSIDPQVSQQLLTTNGSSVQAVSSGNHSVEPSADSKTPDMNDIQVTNISSSIETIGEKSDPNFSMKSLSASADSKTRDMSDIQVTNISSSIETIGEKSDPNISMKSLSASADSKTRDMSDIQVTNISSSIETIGEKSDPNISMKSLSASADSKTSDMSDMQVTNILSSIETVGEKSDPNISMKSLSASADSKTSDMNDIQVTNISSSIETIGEKSDPNISTKSLSASADSKALDMNDIQVTNISFSIETIGEKSDPNIPMKSLSASADSKTRDMSDIQVTNISSSIETIGEKSDSNISMKSLSAASSPSTGLQSESSQQINSKALICKETSESETLPILSEPAKCENLQPSQDFQVEQTESQDNAEVSSDKHVNSTCMTREQKESHGGENLTFDSKPDDLDVAQANFIGGSETIAEGRQHSALSSDSSHAVEWIGDVLQVVDEKKFYQSCSVNGITYRLQDHALFPSSHGKLTPSKIQSMWEDCKTGLNWVKVTNCYFPDNLPGNISHPCISEVNEVYESNSDRTEMLGSIQGPCEVLPSDKFKQENDRRCQLENEPSASVQPIFLCRWFYDEIKSFFQPVTS